MREEIIVEVQLLGPARCPVLVVRKDLGVKRVIRERAGKLLVDSVDACPILLYYRVIYHTTMLHSIAYQTILMFSIPFYKYCYVKYHI